MRVYVVGAVNVSDLNDGNEHLLIVSTYFDEVNDIRYVNIYYDGTKYPFSLSSIHGRYIVWYSRPVKLGYGKYDTYASKTTYDEFYVWDEALSDADAAELYNNGAFKLYRDGGFIISKAEVDEITTTTTYPDIQAITESQLAKITESVSVKSLLNGITSELTKIVNTEDIKSFTNRTIESDVDVTKLTTITDYKELLNYVVNRSVDVSKVITDVLYKEITTVGISNLSKITESVYFKDIIDTITSEITSIETSINMKSSGNVSTAVMSPTNIGVGFSDLGVITQSIIGTLVSTSTAYPVMNNRVEEGGLFKIRTEVGGPGFVDGDIILARLSDYNQFGMLETRYEIYGVVINVPEKEYYLISIVGTERSWDLFKSYKGQVRFGRVGSAVDYKRQDYISMSTDDWNSKAHSPHISVFDGITNWHEIDDTNKLITRIGNLYGINVDNFKGWNTNSISYTDSGYLVNVSIESSETSTDYVWSGSGTKYIYSGTGIAVPSYVATDKWLYIGYASNSVGDNYSDIVGNDYIGFSIQDSSGLTLTADDFDSFFDFDRLMSEQSGKGIGVRFEYEEEWEKIYLHIAYKNTSSGFGFIYDEGDGAWSSDKRGVYNCGHFYSGAEDGTSYLKYDPTTKTTSIKGNFNILNAGSINLSAFNDDENWGSSINLNAYNIALNVSDIEDNADGINVNAASIVVEANRITQSVTETSLSDAICKITNSIGEGGSRAVLNVDSLDIDLNTGETIYIQDSTTGKLYKDIIVSTDAVEGANRIYINNYTFSSGVYIDSGVKIASTTLDGRITTEAGRISLIVSEVGDGDSVTAASIVLAINDEGSSVVIEGDHININGNTTFGDNVEFKGDLHTQVDGSNIAMRIVGGNIIWRTWDGADYIDKMYITSNYLSADNYLYLRSVFGLSDPHFAVPYLGITQGLSILSTPWSTDFSKEIITSDGDLKPRGNYTIPYDPGSENEVLISTGTGVEFRKNRLRDLSDYPDPSDVESYGYTQTVNFRDLTNRFHTINIESGIIKEWSIVT